MVFRTAYINRTTAIGGSVCGRTLQPCLQAYYCMPQADNRQNQVLSCQKLIMPSSGHPGVLFEVHPPETVILKRVLRVAQNTRQEEHIRLQQGLQAEDMRRRVLTVRQSGKVFRHREAYTATRRLRQRAFSCLAFMARAKAPLSSLRFSGSAYLANAPLAVARCGNEMEIGMDLVKTHCRANMRRASANEVPSSRKRISASCFSSVSIRNCMTVDFADIINNKTSLLDDCNYTTPVIQVQDAMFNVVNLHSRMQQSRNSQCSGVKEFNTTTIKDKQV